VIDDDFGVVSMHHRGTDFPIVSRMQKVAKVAFLFEVTPDTIHGVHPVHPIYRLAPESINALERQNLRQPLCHSRLALSPRDRACGVRWLLSKDARTRTAWRSEIKRRVEANEGRFKQTK
jgi:hypothetical protein